MSVYKSESDLNQHIKCDLIKMLTLVQFFRFFFLKYQYFGYFQNDSHIRKYARTVHIFRKFYFSHIQNVYSNWHIVHYEKNCNRRKILIFQLA